MNEEDLCERCGEPTYDNGMYCLACEEYIFYEGWDLD